ncbi:MAG: hypothetical protein LBE75_02660 [Burkholderiales bacterium]|jgi:hypothetical protein|nr:hypothetical protein [Burkholderiales bacterium]
MKTCPSAFLLILLFAIVGASSGGDKVSCSDPALSREQLIDIYTKQISYRRDEDVEKLKKGTFIIREERCAYVVTRDELLKSRERGSVKINRKGGTVFVYFARHGFGGGEDQACKDPPLSGEHLIDIYVKAIHKRSGASIEKIKEGDVYTIWEDREDGCVYVMGSHNSQVVGNGPLVKISRRGKVILFELMS